MPRKYFILASLAVILTGCTLSGNNPAPTPYPPGYLPTVVYLTAQSINSTASAGATPTDAPTVTPTFVPPTLAPTLMPTPAPGFSFAAIQIIKPGPGSRIVSPLEVQVLAIAGSSKTIVVGLFGDGVLINRSIKNVSGYPTGDYLSVKIPFQIRGAVAEVGVIQVSTNNKSGGLQSLSSVRVILLSSGVSQINPAGNAIYERVTFTHLPPNSDVSGGVLSVQGTYTPYNQQPVVLELISDAGQGLSLRVLNFSTLEPQNFSTTLPYKVSKPTQARLYLHQEDDTLKGPVYVYSQEITLNP